ncbi:hypothetical protein FNV43_RR09053 [Rhamnella rubrinervis]|uniref:Uncharacterized protein n=1 Tax=Rhamnella rubrinervis TaxID=2594499 RepID=A0A8K0MJZ3_9ROSA|nr:hypothetical protein FNV43_RR09053 [Rhamnella rubrinervis]
MDQYDHFLSKLNAAELKLFRKTVNDERKLYHRLKRLGNNSFTAEKTTAVVIVLERLFKLQQLASHLLSLDGDDGQQRLTNFVDRASALTDTITGEWSHFWDDYLNAHQGTFNFVADARRLDKQHPNEPQFSDCHLFLNWFIDMQVSRQYLLEFREEIPIAYHLILLRECRVLDLDADAEVYVPLNPRQEAGKKFHLSIHFEVEGSVTMQDLDDYINGSFGDAVMKIQYRPSFGLIRFKWIGERLVRDFLEEQESLEISIKGKRCIAKAAVQ